MKPGYIYELRFPFEEGQGVKKRPVFIIVLTQDKNKVVGLKITGTPRFNRVPILDSPNFGLSKASYVQCDTYAVFSNEDKIPRGKLSEYDMGRIINKFLSYQ